MAQRKKNTAHAKIGAALAATLATLVLPRAIQRGAPYANEAHVATIASLGLIILACVFVAQRWITRHLPTKTSHQLVSEYVGRPFGMITASCRVVGYLLLLILSAGMVGLGFNALTPITFDGRFIMIPILIVGVLPVMIGWKFPRTFMIIGLLCAIVPVIAIVVVGVVYEATHPVSMMDLLVNRVELVEIPARIQRPLETVFIISCFLAALLILVSENIGPEMKKRRVDTRFLAKIFTAAVLVIAVTFYVENRVNILTLPVGVPQLVMSSALWGKIGLLVSGICMIIFGVVSVFSLYDGLPQLLRGLAIDRTIPVFLAAKEAKWERRTAIMGFAILTAFLGMFLSTTHAGTVAFVFVCFVIFVLTCTAITQANTAILRKSERREERRDATIARLMFVVCGACSGGILIYIVIVSPLWALTSLAAVALPAGIMMMSQRGRGKMTAHLKPAEITSGRYLPVRSHTVVLVSTLDLPTLRAVTYARTLRSSTTTAITVDFYPEQTRTLKNAWRASEIPVSLTVLGTPAGGTREPIVDYIRALLENNPNDVVILIVPKIVSTTLWHRIFLKHSIPRIFADLSYDSRIMLVQVPYEIQTEED
ncbi:hypothetical protein [Actinotignum urinale]|uniref:APC family permease n=1 Tax=Actinotignum urinale TaxID=190146 RepID=A0AAW9HY66_9ACTO|nr:hypothetical protein [Actinotignum urinale]MDY5129508.1 hypothetical protein [Actinotignum urinale]MDY5155395.1 hypothetical protein [Actinotignum urinale]